MNIGDGMDVFILLTARNLNNDIVRSVVPAKLTSGRDHRAAARAQVEARYQTWENERGRELPHETPTRDEMRDACFAAIDRSDPEVMFAQRMSRDRLARRCLSASFSSENAKGRGIM